MINQESAMNRIQRLRASMIVRESFFGVLATRLKLVERNDIATASTDGIHLFFSPAYIASLNDSQCITLIAHEVLHCSNGHFARLGNRDLDLANVAGDYAINGDLVKAEFEPLPNWLHDSRFDNMSMEDIYHALNHERQNKPEQGESGDSGDSGDTGDDSGESASSEPGDDESASQGDSGGSSDDESTGQAQPGKPGNDPGKSGGFHMPAESIDSDTGEKIDVESVARDWQIGTRQAARIAAKQAGEMPGYIQSTIDNLNRPTVDWRAVLADFINDRINMDYSFNRPNRRFLQTGFSMPSLVPDGIGEIVLFADTSGSMDSDAFEALCGELQAMLDSGFVSRIHVVQGDTKLCYESIYEHGDSVIGMRTHGNGGTDFRDCMTHIAESYSHCAAMIGFTDLIVNHNKIGIDPGLPVIWAVWGKWREYRANPEFGEQMEIDG